MDGLKQITVDAVVRSYSPRAAITLDDIRKEIRLASCYYILTFAGLNDI